MKIQIAPSVLSADFGKLNEEIKEVEPYSDRIHFDVMDGHFVPNISFGAPVMKWIKTKLPIDVHLMIETPERFCDDFVSSGAGLIIVHSEACSDLKKVLDYLRGLGVGVGVSIKPATPVSKIKKVLDIVDQVLVMTVEPGFGGQEFMEDMVPKISELRALEFTRDIAVDGGVDDKTARVCVTAGANILVAGNYIFGGKDRATAVKKLRGAF